MAIRVNGIQSEEELEKAQAAAKAQGTTITNYSDWSQILKEFAENGIESTGSYAGDVAKMKVIQEAVAEYIADMQAQQTVQQQLAPQNKEEEKVQNITETDKQQNIKANAAGANTEEILADYMKFYHLLM